MSEKGENKRSEVGMAKSKGGEGRESIKSMEHIGSSDGNGVRFKVQDIMNHPDHSNVRSPEHK